jgi:hypothetical protein
MDSSASPPRGEQEGTAYNGHFDCTCYHPLFVFNQFGDLECCAFRSGNVRSADDWRSVLEPVIAVRRANLPRRRLSPRRFAFQLGRDQVTPLNQEAMARYLENPGQESSGEY